MNAHLSMREIVSIDGGRRGLGTKRAPSLDCRLSRWAGDLRPLAEWLS